MDRAEQAAARLLRNYGVQTPPVDVEAIAEREGLKVVFQPLEDEISGVLVVNGTQGTIGVNAKHHPHRQRFSIAHELGHFLLHARRGGSDEPRVFVDSSLHIFLRDKTSSEGIHTQEIQANEFAAALLMPADLIRRQVETEAFDMDGEDSVRELAAVFRVSEQALTIRLTNLQLLR